MSLPKDIQELVDTLRLAGWSKIDEDDLLYEIFYANDYPKHDSGDYCKWNEVFDKTCEELLVSPVEEGEIGDHSYGILKVKGRYYRTTWEYTTSGYVILDNIQTNIREVTPKVITKTVYEEV